MIFDKSPHKIQKVVKKLIGDGSVGNVIQNMSILASGSLISKIIGFGAYPIITRIYSPEDIGIFAVFTTVVFFLYPFGSMRYSIAIPLPKSDEIAMNIIVLGIILTIFITVLYIIIFQILGSNIFLVLNSSILSDYWWLIVLGVFFSSIFDLLTYWATRIKNFEIIAKSNVFQTLILVIAQVSLGMLGFRPNGLLIGEVLRKVVGVVLLYKKFFIEFKKGIFSVTKRRIILLVKYYKDLPIFHLPSHLLLVLSTKIPILFFAFYYGSEMAGQLGLSLMVVAIPMNLIGRTTSNAYYAEIANIGDKQKKIIRNLSISLTKKLFVSGIIPVLFLVIFSPILFRYIFGAEWVKAGEFTSILAFYLFFEFLVTPLMTVFNVFNAQRKYLKLNATRTAMAILLFMAAYTFDIDAHMTIILYSILMTVHFIYTGKNILKLLE